jgi:N-glycosidase YbiA
MGIIKEFQGENRWLSNFATVDILFEGRVYPSVEHAFVAAKSLDHEWREICTNRQLHPAEVKQLGKSVVLRDDWDEVDEEIMFDLLTKKFNQEPFKSKLIATQNDYIQEGNRWGGIRWGYCLETDKGDNLLGFMIMKIRESLTENNNNNNGIQFQGLLR